MLKFIAEQYRQWQYARYVNRRFKAQRALFERVCWYVPEWVNATCPTLPPRARGHCWPHSPRLQPTYLVNQFIQTRGPEAALCLANAPHTQVRAIFCKEIADVCLSESEHEYA